MSSGDTPAVARRKVRQAIKDARNAQGDTQTQVAEAMEWSLSKVMRIESGEVTISPNDLRPLLTYLGVRDRGVVDELVQAAKASKQRRQWWDDKRYQGLLTTAMRQQMSYEAEATVIRSFAPSMLPGWLQSEAYAFAITSEYAGELSDVEIRMRSEIRAARQRMLLERVPAPRLFALFDETVLLRQYGGPDVLREALTVVNAAIEQGKLTVRIHPMHRAILPFGQFDMLYLSSEDETHAAIYRESFTVDEIVEDSVRIVRHREGWDRMWEASIDPVESANRIAAAAKHPVHGAEVRSADEGSSA